MRLRTTRTLAILAPAILTLALAQTASAAEITGRRHIYLYATDPIETLDNVYTPVPEMSTSFELNNTRSILATFCAETWVHGTLLAQIRIDGSSLIPGSASLDEEFNPGPSSEIRTHCFTYAAPNLAPGAHTLEVLWRKLGTSPGSGYARMFFRTLVLEIL